MKMEISKFSMTFKTFLLLFIVVTTQVSAAPPGRHLSITQVFVDDPIDPASILIQGASFLHGPGSPIVTLGEFGILPVVGIPTDNLIYVSLPEAIAPGDYLITVSTGSGQSQSDEYDFTMIEPGVGNIAACDDGSAIREISLDGSVSCEELISPTTEGDVLLESTSGEVEIVAGSTRIIVQSNGVIRIEGNTVNIKSKGNLNLSGAAINMTSSSNIRLNAANKVDIDGALVDIDGGLVTLN
jgi:hypothetical protein